VGSRRVLSFSLLGLLVFAAVYCGAQNPATPALDQIVTAMQQRQAENHASARPYSIVREYRLFGSDSAQEPESVVVARIDYLDPDHTRYAILRSSGSSHGVGIVHRVLDNETEIHKDPQNYGVTSDNYKFAFEGEQALDGHRCYVLALHPQRKDHRLIDGRAWVDAESFQIRLMQGEPAKSPSWWLKKVQVTMHYGDIGGVWAPLSTRAVVDVRWFGKRVFSSRELSGSVGATVAATHQPANTQRDSLIYVAKPLPAARKPRTAHPVGSIPAVLGVDVPRF
jgi:hypothetical protein